MWPVWGWQTALAAGAQWGQAGFLHQGLQAHVPLVASPPPPCPPGASRRFPSASPQEEPHLCLRGEGPKALVESAMAAREGEDLRVPLPCYLWGETWPEVYNIWVQPLQVSPRLYSHLTKICWATSTHPQHGELSNANWANWQKLCDSTHSLGKNQRLSHWVLFKRERMAAGRL